MEKLDVAAKMRKLIEYLNHHQDLYDAGTPQISDTEWDKAYLELKALETEFQGITFELDEISYFSKDTVTLEGEDKEKFERLLTMLDDIDDVSNVYHNVEL